MGRVVKDHLGEEYVARLTTEHFFVDFLRDAEEPTGESLAELSEESDYEMPHVYEIIPGLDGLKERLYFFMHQYNEQVDSNT